MHIENGFTDPTTDESLHLVCRGIRRQHSSSERVRLPITINLLRTLKSQLRSSRMSLLEQRLLWTAFTLSFYGSLRASDGLGCACAALQYLCTDVLSTGTCEVLMCYPPARVCADVLSSGTCVC